MADATLINTPPTGTPPPGPTGMPPNPAQGLGMGSCLNSHMNGYFINSFGSGHKTTAKKKKKKK
jgi:hypothetical protein